MSGIAFVGPPAAQRSTFRDPLTRLPRVAAKLLLVAALAPPLLAAGLRQLTARLHGDDAALLWPALLAAGTTAAGDVWADERGRILLLVAGLLLAFAWMRDVSEQGAMRPRGGTTHAANANGTAASSRDAVTSQRHSLTGSAATRDVTQDGMAGDVTNAGALERVTQRAEPPPRGWLVAGLVPYGPAPLRRWSMRPWTFSTWERRGYCAALLGSGGVGKSLLLADLGIAACTGGEWLGCTVTRVPAALYVDAELDAEEFRRRVYPLARGRGLVRPPTGLHYLQLRASLASPEGQAAITRAVKRTRAGVVLVDSLSIGSWSVSLADAGAMSRVFGFLETLGVPVVCIDHLGKDVSKGAVGSFVKQARVRSALQLTRRADGSISVEHAKSNFGPALPSFLILPRVDAEVGVVTGFTRVTSEPPAPLLQQAPAPPPETPDVRLLASLRARGDGACVHRDELAAELGVTVRTTANMLSRLRAAGMVEPAGGGTWRAVG